MMAAGRPRDNDPVHDGPSVHDHRAAGSQTYLERRPAPGLAGHLSSVWVQHVAPGAAPYTQRSVPTGGVELIWRTGAAPVVVGPRTSALVEVLEPGTTVVGVRLRPGAGPAVLGLPADELVDLVVAADELWGPEGAALGERLAEVPARAAGDVLQRHLAGRLADATEPDALVGELVRRLMPGRDAAVGALPAAVFVSERQLRRRCLAAVGLSPKALHRTLRFQGFLARVQHALAQGRPPAGDGLARLAAECGYADQAHLTRECRRLTGLAPSAFLGRIEHHCVDHDHEVSFAPMLRR
jgi:AraC-like DNA-binding protein